MRRGHRTRTISIRKGHDVVIPEYDEEEKTSGYLVWNSVPLSTMIRIPEAGEGVTLMNPLCDGACALKGDTSDPTIARVFKSVNFIVSPPCSSGLNSDLLAARRPRWETVRQWSPACFPLDWAAVLATTCCLVLMVAQHCSCRAIERGRRDRLLNVWPA